MNSHNEDLWICLAICIWALCILATVAVGVLS